MSTFVVLLLGHDGNDSILRFRETGSGLVVQESITKPGYMDIEAVSLLGQKLIPAVPAGTKFENRPHHIHEARAFLVIK